MPTTVYHYPSCSTCKKALKWLDARGESYTRVHLVEQTPDTKKLADLHARSGLPVRKFFNTSGNSYRNGGFKEKLASMTEAQAFAALAADGMLIKRPILDAGATVRVGFKEEEWEKALG